MAADITRAIEAIWRIEAAKLVAGVARLVRDVALAEDLAQDALVSALDQWPKQGIPNRPGAWLMAVAKRRAVDFFRRGKLTAQKHEELARSIETLREEPDPAAALDDDIGDDLLGLIFTACHPLLAEEGRVALTLRLIGGLTTEEIARAFLVSEATIAQRIVRAKRRLSEAGIPFELPRGEERARRLPSVLKVLYAIFNEGYSATAGEDWVLKPGQLTPGDADPAVDPTNAFIPGTWRRVRNKDNDYLIDRQRQRTYNYSGLPGNRVEDAAMTESMGPIYDRTQEHLGTTDVAIIFWRRMMLRLARNLEKGIEPAILSDPNLFRAVPLQTTAAEPDFGALWSAHHDSYRSSLALA